MKRIIKKVAAAGAGGLMLLSAFGGAFAAGETLADLPAPFIVSDSYVDTAMVVGSAAGTNDDAARSTLKTYFDGLATAEAAGLGDLIQIEEIKLQDNIATSTGLDTIYDDSDSAIFDDAEVSIAGTSYDYHHELQITATANNFDMETSLTSSDDKYEWDPKLEIRKDAIKYCYTFDEHINVSGIVSTSNPFDMMFLGKTLRVDAIASNSSFTAQVGDTWVGHTGEVYSGNGITMEVVAVDGTSAIIDFGNDQRTISEGSTVSEGEIDVYLDSAIAGVGTAAEAVATFVIGEDARVTYKDGDKYPTYCSPSDAHGDPDCDKNNPDWVWDIKGLQAGALTSGASGSFNEVCIENDFEAYNYNKDPAGTGEYYGLPEGYAYIGVKDFNVADDDYMQVQIYTDSQNTEDLTNAGLFPSAAIVISIVSDENEGLVLDQSAIEAAGTAKITSDIKTDEIFLWTNTTFAGNNSATADRDVGRTLIFYTDSDNKVQHAGNISNNANYTAWGYVNYRNTKSTDMVFGSYGDIGADDAWYLGIIPDNATDVNDNLWWRIQSTNATAGNYLGFGTTDNSESTEVVWGATLAPSATATAVERVMVGAKKYDLLTGYGIRADETDSSGDNDLFTLQIPGDQVKANVGVYEGGAATNVEAVLVTESGAAGYNNLILVGGPCVNSLTAEWMSLTYPACESASGIAADTAVIKLMEDGDKMALIVAGWEKADTARAASSVAASGLTGTEQIV
ncbi:MAG: hypothetical protein ABIH25_01845 [Candidatus Woesearchaeota archaeon]